MLVDNEQRIDQKAQSGVTRVDIKIGGLIHRTAEAEKIERGSERHEALLFELGEHLANTPGAIDVLKRMQTRG